LRTLLRRTVAAIAALGAAAALSIGHAQAQDCPTAKNGATGFIVQRGEDQKSEIFHDDGGIVRTVMRYGGKTLLETTQFQGIFQLDRVEEGRHAVIKPQTDLAPLFPLKIGRDVTAKFEFVDSADRSITGTVNLAVKKADPVTIGRCKYSVVKVERSESRGDGPMRYYYNDYYSPELKLILMKEYRNADGTTRFVKYDRIYPIRK
jgi:hypothetical protein